MTVTLTYDSALARVRLSVDGLAAADHATIERSTDQIAWSTVRGGVQAAIAVRADLRDTFTRSVSNGWGTADTGQSWTTSGGTAADYSVNGTRGVIAAASLSVDRSCDPGLSLADVDISGDVQNVVTPTGGSFEIKIVARFVDSSNFVDARLFLQTSGAVTCAVRQLVGGSETTSGFPTVSGVTATSLIAYRFQASGPLLRFKAWLSGTAEPAAWTVELATTHQSAGAVRVGNFLPGAVTNTLPVNFTYDNIVAGPRVAAVDDYEFVAGKQNFYRVRGIETGAITHVGVGTGATGNNSSITPAHPSGLLEGDLKVILASIRNSGTGTVNTPAGWQVIRNLSGFGEPQCAVLLGKRHVASDAAPLITFNNGVANADTLAQMAAWRRADVTPSAAASQLNGSAQDINFPALTVPQDNQLVLVAGWKQDDYTSVATLAGMTEIAELTSTAGDDAGQVWDYRIQTTKTNIAAASLVVTGGAAAISRAATVALPHAAFLAEQTANITPVLDRIWLKSITRPFLNRAVTVVDWSDPERPDRGADFAAVGRTYAVGVTDVGGGKAFDLHIHCATAEDVQTLDYVVASGDLLFVHLPLGCQVPGGYVRVAGGSERRPRPRATSRVFLLPLRQVAAPGPDVVGAVSTWQTVLNSYASWAAVLAANPTWADLLARVAQPTEVIVP